MTNTMKKMLIILMLIILCSCENKKYRYSYHEDGSLNEKIEITNDSIPNGEYLAYYPSGNIRIKAHIDSGKMNGLKYYYHENGVLSAKINIVDDEYHGTYTSYHKNGNIDILSNYKHDLLYGESYFFFEADSGKIEEEFNHLIVHGEEIEVLYRKYNRKGEMVEESRHMKIYSNTDTLNLGDTSIVQVEMIHPRFHRMDVWLANYDEQFYCDSTTLDSIPAINHISKVPIIAQDTGVQYLRGYVSDYEVHDTDSGLVRVSSIYNYFEYEYYVLPK